MESIVSGWAKTNLDTNQKRAGFSVPPFRFVKFAFMSQKVSF